MTIFLFERNGDVSVHATVPDAENYMESPDILNGEYLEAFDEQGNIFSVSAPAGGGGSGLSVSIAPGILRPSGEKSPARLYAALQKHFGNDMQASPSLEELIARAIKFSDEECGRTQARLKKINLAFAVLFLACALLLLMWNIR
jgi:hypothetical protein